MIEVMENAVRFDETDAQGVVYYGEFFTFMDEAFVAYLDDLGFSYDDRREQNWTTHVVHAKMDYQSNVGLGDVVVNAVRFDAIGGSSITVTYEASDAETDRTIATGECVYVTVDGETGDPIDVPRAVRRAAARAQETPPTDGQTERRPDDARPTSDSRNQP
ncbi:MAG: acyl-CoA thioesterase [Halanaeroarchaeum sp.]